MKVNVLKKAFVLVAIIIALFSLSSQRINAASKCFDDTTGKFTTWAECLGGNDIVFRNNVLYTGLGTFYEDYWVSKYNLVKNAGSSFYCNYIATPAQCQKLTVEEVAQNYATSLTSNRIIADVFFAVISIIVVIFVVKLVIAVMKYAAAGDSEEVVKTQKKIIRSMLTGIGMIVIFLIVAEIITNLLGLGNFWEIGFRLRIV